jgi:hypothetical protein
MPLLHQIDHQLTAAGTEDARTEGFQLTNGPGRYPQCMSYVNRYDQRTLEALIVPQGQLQREGRALAHRSY